MHQDKSSYYDHEEQEYAQFMTKLLHKASEIHEDFRKLSPANQQRIRNDIQQHISLEALVSFIRNARP